MSVYINLRESVYDSLAEIMPEVQFVMAYSNGPEQVTPYATYDITPLDQLGRESDDGMGNLIAHFLARVRVEFVGKVDEEEIAAMLADKLYYLINSTNSQQCLLKYNLAYMRKSSMRRVPRKRETDWYMAYQFDVFVGYQVISQQAVVDTIEVVNFGGRIRSDVGLVTDGYGIPWKPNMVVVAGELIRPTAFAGWLYRVTQSGTLPATEPTWWTDSTQQQHGSATLEAVPRFVPEPTPDPEPEPEPEPELDPYWNNVVSLLHFDDSPSTSSYLDSKSGAMWYGSGQIVSNPDAFGGSEVQLDGSISGIHPPGEATFGYDILSEPFTLEFFVGDTFKGPSWIFSVGGGVVAWSNSNQALDLLLSVGDASAGYPLQLQLRTNTSNPIVVTTGPREPGVRTFVRVVRDNSNYTLEVQGVVVGSIPVSSVPTTGRSGKVFIGTIPETSTTQYTSNATMDEFRFTRGVARSLGVVPVGPFPSTGPDVPVDPTPDPEPDPTTPPDTYWSNVVSLLHFEGAHGETSTTDATGKVWITNTNAAGEAYISTAWSAFGGSSAYTSGGRAFFTTATPDVLLGDKDFTIEILCRKELPIGNISILASQDDYTDSANRGWMFWLSNLPEGNLLSFAMFTNSWIYQLDATTMIQPGVQYYVKVKRVGAELGLYINDVLEASANVGTRVVRTSTAPLSVGGVATVNQDSWGGYIDEFRLTVGVGRPNTGIPTAPFPNN